MNKLCLLVPALLVAVSSCGAGNGKTDPILPSIPSREVSIVDYGALPGGQTLCSEAFREAVSCLSENGGGRVNVPSGVWLSGPIRLESHIELHLENGALLLFSDNPLLYDVVDKNFEGLDARRCISPLYAKDATDIAITGEGVIDGNGSGWRALSKSGISEKEWNAHLSKYPGGVLSDDGKKWFPDSAYREASEDKTREMNNLTRPVDEKKFRRWFRPELLYFENCDRVLLDGCTYLNSPCWNLHPVFCRDLTVRNVSVQAPYYAQNGDGIDIDACRRVLVCDCKFDAGDDAICIKSGKDEDGRRHGIPCEDVVIRGCTVYHGHGGVTIGSEMSGGVRNVRISNCTFIGTDIGLRFKSKRGRGGVVEDIEADNITMRDIVTDAISIDSYYFFHIHSDSPDESVVPADETTPIFRNIRISNVICNGCERAVFVRGLPEMPVRGLRIENSSIISRRPCHLQYCKDCEVFPALNQDGKTAIVAHRGYWKCEAGGMSENSIASLKAAQDNGFWGSECDIHLTADSVIVVNHNKTIGDKLISEHKYADFSDARLPNGETVPTLDEYLDQVEECTSTKLVLEFKNQPTIEAETLMTEMALAKLKAHGLYNPDRTVFISGSRHICHILSRSCPEFIIQFVKGSKGFITPDSLAILGISGFDYIGRAVLEHPQWVKEAHDRGMSTNVWPLEKNENFQKYIELGLDAITTNDPDIVRGLLGEREFRN